MSSQSTERGAAGCSIVSETWVPRGRYITELREAGIGEKVRYEGGQILFSQGDLDLHFYILLSGKVHVSSLSADGRESTFNIMGPGSVIGEAAALTASLRFSAARAMEACVLLQLHASKLEDYIRQSPRFGVALIYVASLKQREAVERLHQVVFESPEQRILHLFERMANTQSANIEAVGTSSLRVHLTHEQIGNLTNLSRVTVTRTLQKLKRAGRVDLLNRVVVLSRQAAPAAH